MRFERAPYTNPVNEGKGCQEWDRWAARWHAAWVTKIWGPPTRHRRAVETTAKEKMWYKAALQVLNALRARNQFRWLTTQAARGCIWKEKSVAGKHWQQTNWVAHVLIAENTDNGEGQKRYIPAQARGTMEGVLLTHPHDVQGLEDGGQAQTHTDGAWIYAMRSIRSRRTYVGATDRVRHASQKEISPGERHREHLQRGWWQSRGYRTGKTNSLPLYRMTKRWETGLSELVMTPLVALRAKNPEGDGRRPERKKRTKVSETTTRRKILALEAAVQRVWKPAYTALWGRPRQTGRVRSIGDNRRDPEPEGQADQELFLVYRSSGTRWNPREDWGAQYRGDTLMLNTAAAWTIETCHQLIRKMCSHGKQAVSAYRIIRRGGERNLTKLWGIAGTQGRTTEHKVWTHIARAMHGRQKPVRRNRPTVKMMESTAAATVPLVKWAWEKMQELGAVQDDVVQHVRLQKPPTVRIGETIRTDISWQGKLCQETHCTCQRLRRWTQEQWGIMQTLPHHRGHAWTTLDWLTERVDFQHQSELVQWLRKCMGGEQKQPLLATQYLTRTNEEVIREAANVVAKAAAIQTTCRRASKDYIAVVRGAVTKAMRKKVDEGLGKGHSKARKEQHGVEEHKMTSAEVRRYLRIPWAVVSPMDKAKHRIRIACPVTAWRELDETAAKYCDTLATMSTPEASEHQRRWMMLTQGLHEKWKQTGMPAPPQDATPATARTVPKGKDPMNKSRLLVGTHVTPGRKQAKVTCRAAEFLVALAYADGAGRNHVVESTAQVRQRIEAMTNDLQAAAAKGRTKYSGRKYDFVAFFQEVPRQEVRRSIQYWGTIVRKTYPGKKTIRIETQARELYGRAHPRENRWKTGAGYVPRIPDCTLTRGGGTPAHGVFHIPVRAIPEYLDADAETLIATGITVSQQRTGLTIGSSWGGTGAKLWATHRELMQERQLTRQAKREACQYCGEPCVHEYETVAHGMQNSRIQAMRWVDDRWAIITGCCDAAVTQASRMEYIKYTGWSMDKKCALTHMWPPMQGGDKDEKYWQRTIDTILGFLGKYIDQTREDVREVVGMDIGVQEGTEGAIQYIPAWGESAVASTTTRIVTRPHTKDEGLITGAVESATSCTAPRIHPKRLCQGAEETRRVLAATMIRFADMTNPVWTNEDNPGETLLTWWEAPWRALRAELLLMGWSHRVWVEAAQLTGLEPSGERERVQQHRAKLIWTMAERAAHTVGTRNMTTPTYPPRATPGNPPHRTGVTHSGTGTAQGTPPQGNTRGTEGTVPQNRTGKGKGPGYGHGRSKGREREVATKAKERQREGKQGQPGSMHQGKRERVETEQDRVDTGGKGERARKEREKRKGGRKKGAHRPRDQGRRSETTVGALPTGKGGDKGRYQPRRPSPKRTTTPITPVPRPLSHGDNKHNHNTGRTRHQPNNPGGPQHPPNYHTTRDRNHEPTTTTDATHPAGMTTQRRDPKNDDDRIHSTDRGHNDRGTMTPCNRNSQCRSANQPGVTQQHSLHIAQSQHTVTRPTRTQTQHNHTNTTNGDHLDTDTDTMHDTTKTTQHDKHKTNYRQTNPMQPTQPGPPIHQAQPEPLVFDLKQRAWWQGTEQARGADSSKNKMVEDNESSNKVPKQHRRFQFVQDVNCVQRHCTEEDAPRGRPRWRSKGQYRRRIGDDNKTFMAEPTQPPTSATRLWTGRGRLEGSSQQVGDTAAGRVAGCSQLWSLLSASAHAEASCCATASAWRKSQPSACAGWLLVQ